MKDFRVILVDGKVSLLRTSQTIDTTATVERDLPTIIERWLLYRLYISVNFSKYEDCYGQCQKACGAMAIVFPELTIKKGYVSTPWGERGHWWMLDPTGAIVDPTARQFPGIFEYREFVPGSEVIVGKCMNCGDEIWRAVQSLDNIKQECICSKECEVDYTAYLNEEARSHASDR